MADEATEALGDLNLCTESAKDTIEPENRQRGSVRWFNASKGFGFIQPHDLQAEASEGYDLFCHQTSIRAEGFRSLREGEAVEYDLEIGDDGRNKAVNVTGPDGAPPQGAPKRIPVQAPRRHHLQQPQQQQQLQYPLSPQHMPPNHQLGGMQPGASPTQMAQANALYEMHLRQGAEFHHQQHQPRPQGALQRSQIQQQHPHQQWPPGAFGPAMYSVPMQQQPLYGGSTAGFLGGSPEAEMQRMQAAMQAPDYYGRRPLMPPSPLATQWLGNRAGFGPQYPQPQQHPSLQQHQPQYGSNGRGRSGLGGGVADRRPPPGTPGVSSGLQVVVHNLPWNIGEEQLAGAFTAGGAPPVERAAIIVDSNGRSRGFGTVLFKSSAEAETAVDVMNNADVGGRAVTVRIDRFA